MGSIITYDKDTKLNRVSKLGITSEDHKNRAYEPQTQNTFTFQFLFDAGQTFYIKKRVEAASIGSNKTVIGGSGNALLSASNHAEALTAINDYLNSSLQSITSPTKNIGQIAIDFFNTQVKFAGKPTYSDANITLNTLIGIQTKNILSAWSDMCLNDSTLAGGWARSDGTYSKWPSSKVSANTVFPHIGYKVDGVLLECARDGTIVNQWEYIGMWLKSFTPGSFTMSGANTPSQVSGTIAVDLIRQSKTKFNELKKY